MRFEQYLDGMVEICLPWERTEDLFVWVQDAGLSIYQIRQSEEGICFWITLEEFGALQRLLRTQHCRFHIVQKCGIPFWIHRGKRRRGLWMGIVTAFACICLMLSFLWGYAVSGNVSYSDAHMIALVQEYGLVPGTSKYKFDYAKIEKQILQDHPEFVWIQLRPVGTTLQIVVKEGIPAAQEQKRQGSLLAESSGKITELLVFRGTALVKRGDWVKQGQVLIGGWDYPDRERNEQGIFVPSGEPFAVQAKGVIRGEKERTAVGLCALEEQRLQKTGAFEKQIALICCGKRIVLYGPRKVSYRYYEKQSEIHPWFPKIPIYVKTTIFEEKQRHQVQHTPQEAYQLAVDRARKQLQKQLPRESRFLRESIGVTSREGETVLQVTVVWTVEETLAQVQLVELPEAQEENVEKTTVEF